MSITAPKSVLVIGAGTSKQYGIPDGNELFELIVEQLKQELSDDELYETKKTSHILFTNGSDTRRFEHSPIICSLIVNSRDGLNKTDTPNKLYWAAKALADTQIELAGNLLALLQNQTSETIDDFIFQNPELAEITKIAVATIIFNKLYMFQESLPYKLIPLDFRYLTVGEKPNPDGSDYLLSVKERNWVHLFINLVRESVRKKRESPDSKTHVSPDNKVKVISFNYDMILEHILDKQFMNTSATIFSRDDTWEDYIEVFHVHGKFEGMKDNVSNPYEVILDWANSIAVIHEEEPQEYIKGERAQAKEVMSRSNQVYGTGFSFSKSNVELIGLVANNYYRKEILIYYSNYDGDYGLSVAMGNYEKDDINNTNSGVVSYTQAVKVMESAGSGDKLMSTVNWFYSGVPGRLPS